MRLPYIENIWRVRQSLILDEPMSAAETFAKLNPMLQTNGTSYEIVGDKLTYRNENPAAQDKLATFSSGSLQVTQEQGRTRLFMDLFSPALLLCFLAPLLFIGFGQLAVAVNAWDTPADDETEESVDAEEEEDQEDPQLHPIDAFLGAPQPETLAEKKAREEKEEAENGDEGEHDPVPAYVLAGIFAFLYGVGRILEPWLIRKRFRAALTGQITDTQLDSALPSPRE